MREELKSLIDNNEVISFDIFDTLILRNIFRPIDIFRILEKIALDKYNITNFFDIRVTSEKEARNINNNFECNINEIYDIISDKLKDKQICSKLKEEELNLELKFCVSNPFMKKVFDYCKKKEKKIILISDMYLELKFIKKILEKNGYDINKIYVSCEYRKNKGSLELFKLVKEKEKLDYNKWLHIGDNNYSDYKQPLSLGMSAYNYKKVSDYVKIKPNSIFESIILGIQSNWLYNGNENDYWDKFGVKYISPIYFGFTKWLYDLTKDKDNLFFIARDGYIIDKIYSLFNIDKKVYTKYLYLSRNSVQIPSMILADKDSLVESFTQEVDIDSNQTLKELLEKSQINLDKYDDLSFINDFGFKDINELLTEDNRYGAVKLVAWLYDDIKENLINKKDLVLSYLEQENVDKYKKINIMDIGWAGSIQSSIERLLNKEVFGYYFGTVNSKKKNSLTNMFGYYFDLDVPETNKKEIIDNVMMYELIFSAPHGSACGYQNKDGKVIPILSDDVKYSGIIESFQKAALKMIEEYIEYLDYFDYLSKDFCLCQYIEFLNKKDYYDLSKFKDISNDLMLGSKKQFPYVGIISAKEINDKDILLDISSKSLWKDTFYIDDDGRDTSVEYLYAMRKLSVYKYEDDAISSVDFAKIYLDLGNGFSEDNIVYVPYVRDGYMVNFKFKIDSDVKGIRIDPIESHKLVMRHLTINSDKGYVKFKIPHKDYLKSKLNNCIYINSKDPKIVINDVKELEWIFFSAMLAII